MPNYNYVAGAHYKPYSMQEMLVPFMLYKEESDKREQDYLNYAEKMDAIKQAAEENPDSRAAKIYNTYNNDYQREYRDWLDNGLSINNKRGWIDLKRRYTSEIGMLEKADALRRQHIEEQRAAKLKDPTLLFSRTASSSSLDDYLDKSTLDYNSYSGAVLASQVGTAAGQIAKELRDYGNGKPLDSYTKTWLQQHGFTAAEVAQAINNPDDPSSSKVLNTLVNNVIVDSGIPQWGNADVLNQAYGYARQGLWQAVGQTQVSSYDDYGSKLAAQTQKQKDLIDYQLSKAAGNGAANEPQINPKALRSQQELDSTKIAIDTFVKNGYMEKGENGRYVITEKGKKAYNITSDGDPTKFNPISGMRVGAGGFDSQGDIRGLSFKRFIDSLNGDKNILDASGNIQTDKINSLFNDAVTRNSPEQYDIYHSTEYVRQIPESYAKEVKRQILSEGDVLQKLEFQGKEGFKGKDFKKEELEKFSPTRINYSKYGNTITWINDKGESIRTNAPIGVNESVSSELKRAFEYESVYSQILQAGKLPKTKQVWGPNGFTETIDIDKDGIVQFTDTPLTYREMQAYTNDWNDVMSNINNIGAMYVAPSTTKTREFSSYNLGSVYPGSLLNNDLEE